MELRFASRSGPFAFEISPVVTSERNLSRLLIQEKKIRGRFKIPKTLGFSRTGTWKEFFLQTQNHFWICELTTRDLREAIKLFDNKLEVTVLMLPKQQQEPTLPGHLKFLKNDSRGFPGGPVVKNPPSNTPEDLGLIPGPRTKFPQAAGQLSPQRAST